MEKIKFTEEKANAFVKDAMHLIGYPEELEMKTYIGDNKEPNYLVYYKGYHHGKIVNRIKPLRKMDYILLLTFSLEVSGVGVEFVNPVVREEKISYEITTKLAEYGPRKRKNIKKNR